MLTGKKETDFIVYNDFKRKAGAEMPQPSFIENSNFLSDMSDSVKQKRLIHCPLFYRGFSISYAGVSTIDRSCY